MPNTPPVSARPNRFGFRSSATTPALRVLVNSSSSALALAFQLEAVAHRPGRVLLDRDDRLDRLHAVDGIAKRHRLDVDETEDVGVVEPLARQRPLVEIDRLAQLEAQRLGQHLAVRDLVAGELDVLQHLLRCLR